MLSVTKRIIFVIFDKQTDCQYVAILFLNKKHTLTIIKKS